MELGQEDVSKFVIYNATPTHFIVKFCHIQCNSDSMLETHLNGSKHLKKMKQLGQEDVSTGTNSTSTDYSQPPLFPIEFEAWQIRIPSQLEKEKQQQNSRKGNT